MSRAGARPAPPATTSRSRGRALRRTLRAIAIVVSVATLAATGYGWSIYRQIGNDLVTSDVLTPHRSLDGSTDILLVGLDSRTDASGNPLPRQVLDELSAGSDDGELNTDTLILVRIPNDPAKVSTAVSIPRDSYVTIPGGYGTHKINSAFSRARNDAITTLSANGVAGAELEREADQAGAKELITTVEALTGASIDHYAEVNLAGFAEITRTVGGVPVCLSAPAHDKLSGADFAAGPQTVEGASALSFVRQRHGLPRGDLDRVVRQQAFLASLAHKLLSAGTLANPATLSHLISVIGRYVVIDQWDLVAFAAQVSGLSGGNITFRTIPTGRPDLPTPADGQAVQVDPALVKAFFADLGDQQQQDQKQNRPVLVDVSNGTSRTGLAAGASDLLDDNGFAPGVVRAADPAARSSVRAAAADEAAAQQVASLLGGLPVEVDATVAAGRVEVLLGRDYTPPPANGTPSHTPSRSPAPQAGDDAPGAPPTDAKVITADGVPCVN